MRRLTLWTRISGHQLRHSYYRRPAWARVRCRISPPRFLAVCCKRQLNQGSFVLLCFRLSTFSDLYWVCLSLYFPVLFCLSVSVKWLAVKTASEMTYTVSSGALNSTPTNHELWTRISGRQLRHSILRSTRLLPPGPILRNFSGCTISKVHVWCNALTLSKVATS